MTDDSSASDQGLGQEIYRSWAAQEDSLPVWHQPWWLDATSGTDSWSASIATDRSGLVAVLPYVHRRKMVFSILSQPVLTQSLGPWFGGRRDPKLSQQHSLLQDLLNALPGFTIYQQNWMPEITNWLPFYWQSYKQSTRYTYRLDLSMTADELWLNLSSECRTAIRKAQNRAKLQVIETGNIETLRLLVKAVYQRQGMGVPFDLALLEKIYMAGQSDKRVTSYLVVGQDGEPHAGLLIVHDNVRSYYLVGGVSESGLRNRAMNLGMWHAVLIAKEMGSNVFDFEGSMMKPVERFFRTFGAQQTPYFRVTRCSNRFLCSSMNLLGKGP